MITLETALMKHLERTMSYAIKGRDDAMIAFSTSQTEAYERLSHVNAAYDNMCEAMRYIDKARSTLVKQLDMGRTVL